MSKPDFVEFKLVVPTITRKEADNRRQLVSSCHTSGVSEAGCFYLTLPGSHIPGSSLDKVLKLWSKSLIGFDSKNNNLEVDPLKSPFLFLVDRQTGSYLPISDLQPRTGCEEYQLWSEVGLCNLPENDIRWRGQFAEEIGLAIPVLGRDRLKASLHFGKHRLAGFQVAIVNFPRSKNWVSMNPEEQLAQPVPAAVIDLQAKKYIPEATLRLA